MTTPEITAHLGAEPFVDLVTFRRDGRPVHTPVWVSTDGEMLFISTFGHSGKVLRLRHTPLVAVAACTGDGQLFADSPFVAGQALVLDRSEFAPGVRAHKRKYGTHFAIMWPARWAFRLVGRRRVWILITLTPEIALPDIPAPETPMETHP